MSATPQICTNAAHDPCIQLHAAILAEWGMAARVFGWGGLLLLRHAEELLKFVGLEVLFSARHIDVLLYR